MSSFRELPANSNSFLKTQSRRQILKKTLREACDKATYIASCPRG
jgi:hypothetical protein